MPLLEVTDLHVSYGKVPVLRGLSFSLDEGEMVGLIGPNGAGKTTLTRGISGLTPGRGHISFAGESIINLPAHEIVKRHIVLCPEGRRLFPDMSVRRNLEMGAYLRRNRGEVARNMEEILDLFPSLERTLEKPAGVTSGGEQQMLAVARALMARPRLLMLDEPSFGLAPAVKKIIAETLLKIRQRGLTVLLCEQDIKLTFQVVDRALVLENGVIRLHGSTADLSADPYIKDVYLGLA